MELIHKLTSTRAGTVALATLAAILAGASILVYLNRYRNSVDSQRTDVTVLVAKQLIAKGTPGSAVAANGFFTTSQIRESQLRNGAFSDPVSLQGRLATHDVFPGQQLTAEDFAAGATTRAGALTKDQRLIAIPLDSAHGLIGQVQAGDHVDVFAGFTVIPLGPNGIPTSGGQARPMLRLIMQNIPVVSIEKPATTGGVGGGQNAPTNVSLRVTDLQAAELAFASDNGKLWLVLRPSAGAKPSPPGLVTVETLLLGIPPITVIHSLGGRQ
jgi:Flp pilus assembly protein CpaB